MAMGQQVVAHFCCLTNHFMSIPKGAQFAIAPPVVSANNGSRNYRLPYSLTQTLGRGIGHTHKPDPANPFTIFLSSNHNQTFSQSAAPSFARLFSTYIGFINFDQTRKAISSGSDHSAPQFMEPSPCRAITAKTKQSLQTQSASTCLLIGDEPNSPKPHTQRLTSVLKDGSSRHRYLVAAGATNQQLTFGWPSFFSLTPRTNETLRPTQLKEIVSACLFRRKL